MDSSDAAADGRGPLVRFARFAGHKIELFRARTTECQYIAISHVWGNAEWLRLESLSQEILASAKKAAFIENRLRTLVGKTAFWMDIICVDQRNQTEVVANAWDTPAIFRDASKTIAIREGDGFYECCAESIRNATTFGEIGNSLLPHVSGHWKTKFHESYLQRLWTLQEMIWSKNVHFVSDFQVPPDDSEIDWENMDLHAGFEGLTLGDDIPPLPGMPDTGPYDPQTSALILLDALFMAARSFNLHTGAQDSTKVIVEFIQAFFHNRPVSKNKWPSRTARDDIFTYDFVRAYAASSRRATEPRDYILATMSQFPWYRHPDKLLEMPFSTLFLDLYKQSCAAGHPLTCRITRSMTAKSLGSFQAAGEEWLPSADQPEPQSLGDFLKLLGRKTKLMDAPDSYYIAAKASVVRLAMEDLDMTLRVIQATMSFSPQIWFETSRGGELGSHGDQPEQTSDYRLMLSAMEGGETEAESEALAPMRQVRDFMMRKDQARWADDGWIEDQSYKILNLMWLGNSKASRAFEADWTSFRNKDAPRIWSAKLQETLLLLAAMLSCQLPLSALRWTRERFVPVAASHGDTMLLCLLAKSACGEDISSGQEMYIVGRHVSKQATGQDLVLTTNNTIVPVGLVPDFLSYDRTEQQLVTYTTSMARHGFPKNVNEMRSAKGQKAV
ncbi:hypothetical protein IWW34DRAFT_794834 [Fusarium oxysporum f. sp. albedinis]|nr:hypothetical protein IWW34DRAFT_794834 [Fusarium oxysporum f. sp. albedinis]KAJ0132302.1 Uncharacterized protein HZ326_24620 [Fusarium oxysporum f. sp. albedinis]KAK2470498.1 hypothetical protein H9L39_18115 [Fusarium oxysporum f. sp. albedinis]